jgi:hypothetical protein
MAVEQHGWRFQKTLWVQEMSQNLDMLQHDLLRRRPLYVNKALFGISKTLRARSCI